ncbi:MAG: hypothetical protein ABW252_16680 [Polyangiales bacterium]
MHLWWLTLGALAVVNAAMWGLSARAYARRRRMLPGLATRWPHLVLSAGYVLGCGFRGLLPRADVQRIVLVDSWLSSVFVGRSVATVAELCFAAQWALLLRELSHERRNALGLGVARMVLPMIAVAEVCSWYAVLSTSYLGNTLEQSIWTATVGLIALALLGLWWESRAGMRVFLGAAIAVSAGFVAFMCTVDVPMYLTRFLADEAAGRTYFTLAEGLHDVSTRWVVTHALSDWHEEMAWMALYFSVAVWVSIGLVHAPRAEYVVARAAPAEVAQRATA